MKKLFAFLSIVALMSTSLHAQWVDGGRKQSQAMKGNGALIVHDGVMYFWNEENHFQISTDNGATWSDPPDDIQGANPHVVRMSAAGDRVYAALNFGTGQGIPIYSTDQGVTWQPDTLGAPGHALGWGGRPVVADIYAWGRWLYVKWDQPGPYYIKSLDGPFVKNEYMNIGANNPSSVVAKGDTLFASGSKIYYTTDGGVTWTTPANNGYSGLGARLFVDGSRLYMFAYKGLGQPCMLYYSDDNAENWTEVDVTSLTNRKMMGGGGYYPSGYFIRGDRIEFATVQESFNTPPNVWKSTDLGTTWSPDTAGLPTAFATSIVNFAYTPDGMLWAVRSHENIYKQRIDEGTGGGSEITAAPDLMSPSEGAAIRLEQRFVWTSVKNAVRYRVQFATDETFSSSSVVMDRADITDTSTSVASLTFGTSYYWRVQGLGAEDQEGPWSSTGRFTLSVATVDEASGRTLRVTPNPAHDRLTLDLPEGAFTSLEIRDLLGRTIRSERDIAGRLALTIDIGGLAPGSYWLVLNSPGRASRVVPVVVR